MKHKTGGTGWPSGNILDFHGGALGGVDHPTTKPVQNAFYTKINFIFSKYLGARAPRARRHWYLDLLLNFTSNSFTQRLTSLFLNVLCTIYIYHGIRKTIPYLI